MAMTGKFAAALIAALVVGACAGSEGTDGSPAFDGQQQALGAATPGPEAAESEALDGAAELVPLPEHGIGLEWYEGAAEAGSVGAQYRLARLYEVGLEVPGDLAAARRWYRAAAQQGHAASQFALAVLLQTGAGGPRDLPGAARWYRSAGDSGVARAQYNLAAMLEHGQGIEADPARAAALYRAAARGGIKEAGPQLAVMLIDGRGVVQDKAAALAWFILAVEDGVPGATDWRDRLAAELGPADRRKAETVAASLRRN